MNMALEYFYASMRFNSSSQTATATAYNAILDGSGVPRPNLSSQPHISPAKPMLEGSKVSEAASDMKKDERNKLRAAPVFADAVNAYAISAAQNESDQTPVFPQYGVLGFRQEISAETDSIVLHNTEEPFSTFICGSQGSGKSHTLSCLLENSLMTEPQNGALVRPLTGLVFHYDKFAGYNMGQLCESAYLSSGNIKVTVLVAPTSLNRMRKQYLHLPGLSDSAPRPKVMPLYFSERQLSVDMMMTLMAVQDAGVSAPLYISAIRQVLREIALARQDTPAFDYADFRNRLASLDLNKGQCAPLNLRLELLESVLLSTEQPAEVLEAFDAMWRFEPGTLTIIDLSDQFVNESDACALFSICLKLFMEGWTSNPRIVALDEAHKFLTNSSEASKLTDDLISIIRQQRHLNSRVVIATQEPTLSGDLLDLCNVSIIHRFSSPKWYSTIKAHIAGAHLETSESPNLFQEIVGLQTGEATVFCPTAVLMSNAGKPQSLGCRSIRLKVRPRNSTDGGQSIRATDRFNDQNSEGSTSKLAFVPLNGKTLPRPGSLAGKSGRRREMSTAFATNVSSRALSVPQKIEPQSKPSMDGGVSRPESQSISNACPPATTAAANRDMGLKKGKKKEKKKKEEKILDINQNFLEERLRATLLASLQTNPKLYAKDTRAQLNGILRRASVLCNLPRKSLRNHNVLWQGEPTKSVTILQRFLKQYCDDQGIPTCERAKLSWLR